MELEARRIQDRAKSREAEDAAVAAAANRRRRDKPHSAAVMPNWRKYTETRLKVLELLVKCMNKRSYQFIMILRVDSYEMTFQSITAMPRYKTLSAEELRIANYGWDPATAVSIADPFGEPRGPLSTMLLESYIQVESSRQ